MFSLTLVLGIFSAYRLNRLLEIQKISLPQISFWQFLLYFIVATLFILFVSYFLKFKRGKGVFYKGIFVLAVVWGGLISLSSLMPDIFALILMTVLLLWWLKKPSVAVHNIVVILGIAGMGAVLGLQLTPLVIVALLLILSVYDFIAVYKTKHMVKMAKDMLAYRVILALIVPQEIADFGTEITAISSTGSTDWNSTSTWSSSTIPTSIDDVTISHAVTLTNTANDIDAECYDLTIESGKTYTSANGSNHTIHGSVWVWGDVWISPSSTFDITLFRSIQKN